MKWLFLITPVLLITTGIFAQKEDHSSEIDILEHHAGAPNTASLNGYFAVPVNMATGIPNIQIPLYTITSGNITLPISLSYHGGGVKVDEAATWVGLGWSLNCGGVISKQINGLDDYYATIQYPNDPLNQANHPQYSYFGPQYTIDEDLGFTSMTAVIDSCMSGYALSHGNQIDHLLGRIILNQYDGEADEYHYSLPEGGGMIFWNQIKNKFETDNINGWIADASLNPGTGWALTDKTGMTYSFGNLEKSVSPLYPDIDNSSPEFTYTSAWYLIGVNDKISNRNITLHYDESPYHAVSNGVSETKDYNLYNLSFWAQNNQPIRRYGNDITINEIDFDEGKIQFIKDTAPRQDIDGPNALKEIRVYDRNNQLKKKIVFTYTYWSSRLVLQSLQEINYLGASANINPYTFSYNMSVSLPARFSYAQDMYGYYNGKTSNTTLIPTESETQQYGLPSFADRSIDPDYTQAGILNKIIFPTGSYTTLNYENNIDEDNNLAGGLRIKEITNTNSPGAGTLITQYSYNRPNGQSSGAVQFKPVFHYLYTSMNMPAEYTICRVSGSPLFPLFSNQGSPIIYDEVTKNEVGSGYNLVSKHYFMNFLNNTEDAPPITTFRNNESLGVPFNKYANLDNFNCKEWKTEEYKYEGGIYKKTDETTLNYRSLNQFNDFVWNVQAAWSMFSSSFVTWPGNDPYIETPTMNCQPTINAYKFFHESLVNYMTQTIAYDNNARKINSLSLKTFDPDNGNLKKITTAASNGDSISVYYTYPSDLPQTSSSNPNNVEINYLRDNNMIGLPVEVIKTRKPAGGTEEVTDASLYLYSEGRLKQHFKINTILPFSSMIKVHADNNGFYYDDNYELENEIVSFDELNNPREINLKSKKQSLIWDGQYNTAIATNSTWSDLGYTSFESSQKGNWTYSGTPSTTGGAITGTKSYLLSSGSITKTGLTSTKKYILSGWAKGPVTITGGTQSNPVSGSKAINGWTYQQVTITGATSITISGSTYVDELRLYPTDAQMTTYTYEPLVGMTSQCGADNTITYYEYDGLGRLQDIKDQDGNIIKTYDYHYKQ